MAGQGVKWQLVADLSAESDDGKWSAEATSSGKWALHLKRGNGRGRKGTYDTLMDAIAASEHLGKARKAKRALAKMGDE